MNFEQAYADDLSRRLFVAANNRDEARALVAQLEIKLERAREELEKAEREVRELERMRVTASWREDE